MHVLVRQAADGGGQGGGEERGLPFGGGLGQDGFDILDEAHREHLIRFVQHDGAHLAEVEQLAAVDQVEQAPGGADHDVHAALAGSVIWGA